MPYDLELAGNSQMVSGQCHDMLSCHGQSICQLCACDVSLLSYGPDMKLGQTGGWIKKWKDGNGNFIIPYLSPTWEH